MSGPFLTRTEHRSIGGKLSEISWGLVLTVTVIACVGFGILYSVSGSFDPWADRQMIRFGLGLLLMTAVALTSVKVWFQSVYVFYGVALVLLVVVEAFGRIGMGAQRWIDLGFTQIQPSEVMKLALVLALARYYHDRTLEEARQFRHMIIPVILIVVPAALVIHQPDLGTGLLIIMGGAAILFLGGVKARWFIGSALAGLISVPIAWKVLTKYDILYQHQMNRILTFLHPEDDPLGAGYHIMQSKIALGSGGIHGKGFMQGTQAHLNFLPEKQTDFIFTMLGEEFGLIGGLVLLALYSIVFAYGIVIAMQCRHTFGRLVALGVTVTFFLYVFINIAMVMGILPVVGVPLPLVSYGGTAMMTLMIGLGFLLNVRIHRDASLSRADTIE
jgi:rod shape determining protein RodA